MAPDTNGALSMEELADALVAAIEEKDDGYVDAVFPSGDGDIIIIASKTGDGPKLIYLLTIQEAAVSVPA